VSKKTRIGGLSNPSLLEPIDSKDYNLINIVIETPKGCRNKYAFDEKLQIFTLKKVLPSGMAFPYDFGFVPSTLADDGDPTDALVLMDEPAFAGCLVKGRIIGVIQGEQREGKKTNRNDRVVAIENGNHAWSDVKHIEDLEKSFIKELEQFFVNYHNLSGKRYRILGAKGPRQGRKCVEQGLKAFKKGGQ
jgi:inorganic pyrophosphatase